MNYNLCATIQGLVIALAAIPSTGDEPRPFVVGHRGLLQAAPENTLAGFRACLALRVGFEFDIRRTKEGSLVCLHDDTLDRTTDGKGRLAESSLEELKRLDAGEWFDLGFREERVPDIDEILALLSERSTAATLVAVDLKETGGGTEEAVVRLAEQHEVLDRLVFIGETIESAEVRQRLRTSNRGAHTAHLAATPEKIAEALEDTYADWVYVRFLPSPDDMQRIHDAGKRIFLAGPLIAGNEAENWIKAAALEIDAILTDYPLELMKEIRRGSR